MAKTKKAARPDTVPSSLLQTAMNAFEAGDMPATRAAAKAVLESNAGAEEQAARTLAPQLFLETDPRRAAPSADAVAKELIARTQAPATAYAYGALAATVLLLLALLAHVRS